MASTQPATKSLPNPTADDATPRGLSTGQTAQTTIPEMKHWAMIFPAASVEFQKMPDVVAPKDPKPEYDIRIARTWAEVDVKITAAQAHYTNTTGFSGSLRRAWRWSADNVTEPIALATKFVPQTDISMPVLGAVQMILEAVQTGATVRGESLKGLEDLDDVLGDVDLFVSTFLRKDSIRSKAIGLVAVILLAVERVLRFWTRPGCKFTKTV
jgi:hypothetical protein